MLHEEEGAFDVRVEVVVVIRLGHVRKKVELHHARIKHEEVDAPELLHRFVDKFLALCEHSDIRLDDDCPSCTLRVDFVCHALSSGCRRDVVDDDIGSLRCQTDGDSCTDRARRAGNDGSFACKGKRHRYGEGLVKRPKDNNRR